MALKGVVEGTMLNKITTSVPIKAERLPGINARLLSRVDPMMDLVPTDARVVVEIGSQIGSWVTRAVRDLPEKCKIYCVDPWAGEVGDIALQSWCQNVRPWLGNRVIGLRGTSLEVAPYFDYPIDFLFVDGDHRIESVKTDLRLWEPKVRTGGVIVGHDWDGIWAKKVRPAVREYFGTDDIEVGKLFWAHGGKALTNCWVWRK